VASIYRFFGKNETASSRNSEKPPFSGQPVAKPGKGATPPKRRDTGQTGAKRGKPGFFPGGPGEKRGESIFSR